MLGFTALSHTQPVNGLMGDEDMSFDFAERLETPIGEMLFVADSAVAISVKKHFHHDPGVDFFMERHRDSLFPFFDVGANVGLFAIKAAKLGGPVFAFEPDKKNLALLEANIAEHHVDVTVFRVACATEDGLVRMGVLSCGRSAKSTADAIELPSRALRSIVAETGIAPRFVKLDIEGGETDALLGLEGADGWGDVVLEVEYSWRDHGRRVAEWMRMRPAGQYVWEILLSPSETKFAPDLPVQWVDLNGRKFALARAGTTHELEQILEVLGRSTAEHAPRKWELCIRPA